MKQTKYYQSGEHSKNLERARTLVPTVECSYCQKQMLSSGIKAHEKHCYLNPNNIKLCPVCQSPIKNFKEGTTCSVSCANKYFRSGPNNGNWKYGLDLHRKICFEHHEKKCVICHEDKIVEVHHLNEQHNDNRPENLVPLCSTHHKYWHSKYRYLIEDKIMDYMKNWSGCRALPSVSRFPRPVVI